MNLVIADTETNGFDFEEGQVDLVQLCWKQRGSEAIFNRYYTPSQPMKSEASAVNNITDEMLVGCPRFEEEAGLIATAFDPDNEDGTYVIAHNAKFDKRVLSQYFETKNNFIDTLKVTRFMYDLKFYGQQYLRYEWKIKVVGAAHDARTDVLVLEQIFEILLREYMKHYNKTFEEAIADFVSISFYPSVLRKMSFGKHRGDRFDAIPNKYLDWLMDNLERDQDNEDVLYTVHLELERRKTAGITIN